MHQQRVMLLVVVLEDYGERAPAALSRLVALFLELPDLAHDFLAHDLTALQVLPPVLHLVLEGLLELCHHLRMLLAYLVEAQLVLAFEGVLEGVLTEQVRFVQG
jgi:hypothetical protein